MSARTRRRPAGCPVIPLGHIGTKTFCYFVVSTRQVVSYTPGQHSTVNLLALATEVQWRSWSGTPVREGQVVWIGLAEHLMDACRDAGMYDPSIVRGRGAWRDGKHIVYHAGDKLFVDGRVTRFETFSDTKHRYVAEPPILEPDTHPATSTQCKGLLAVLDTWGWQHQEIAPTLMAGWLACAFVCGALGWRPHLWITGPKGSGKSTLDTLIAGILGDLVVHVQGGTTEPGLRQLLNGDARPVAFDEFEADSASSQRVIDAARSAASDNAAPIVKGTPEGKPILYRLRFMAMFSGIIANTVTAADQSRIVFLELRCVERDEDQRADLGDALDQFNAKFGSRLLRRMFNALASGSLDDAMHILRAAIRLNGGDERKADVYAHLLAGYHTLTSDTPLTDAEAVMLVAQLDDLDEAGLSDEEACVMQLLGFDIRMDCGETHTVAELLQRLHDGNSDRTTADSVRGELGRYGVLLDGDRVLVANNVLGIENIYARSRWANGAHCRTLRRLDGAQAAGNQRFAAIQSKATAIPWHSLFPLD